MTTSGSPSAPSRFSWGQAIEYEIANGVAPNFTVVAKMRKSYLPQPVPEKAEK